MIFFLESNSSGEVEYRNLCREKKITAVIAADRGSLKSYLIGEIDSCPEIDLAMRHKFSASDASHQSAGGR